MIESYEDHVLKSENFKGKNLQKSVFNQVVFESCDFSESDWSQAKFFNCHFKNCNITLVKLEGSRLQEVVFEESKLVGLEFYRCDKQFLHLKFIRSILQSCNFSDLILKKTVFQGSKIRESFFHDSDLSESIFIDTDLLGTSFHHCNLSKADFSQAKNYCIDPSTNKLKKARFSFPEVLNLLKTYDIDILM